MNDFMLRCTALAVFANLDSGSPLPDDGSWYQERLRRGFARPPKPSKSVGF